MHIPPLAPDIVISNEGLDLGPYGLAGRVMHMPGHSPGSVTVLLDSGEAFVGDSAMNGLPFCRKPSLPIFADDVLLLKESWRRLLALGVTTVYPLTESRSPRNEWPLSLRELPGTAGIAP